jgi:hypothetical protein
MKTQNEIILNCYDYIVNVTIKQKRLLPAIELYGDGSRWDNRKDIFMATYEQIKITLKENNLI